MSYNLDALTEDNGLADEEPVGSSKRGEKTAKSEGQPLDSYAERASTGSDNKTAGISRLTLVRHIVFFVLFVSAGIAGFLYRDDVMSGVGYAALPLGLWGVLFVYLVIARTRWAIRRYRETISSLILVLGGVTVLGIFDAPLGSATGATMGGRFGEILAREPYDWHRYDLVLWQQALAWVRAGAFFTIGAAFQFPTVFGMGLKVMWIGTLMVMSASISLFMMAGGAAATIARKRHRDKSGVWVEGDEQSDVGNGESLFSVDSLDDVTEATCSEPALIIREDVLGASNEFVVDVGNTILVEDDEEVVKDAHVEYEDDWQSLSRNERSRVAHSSIASQDDLPEFVAVGDHLGEDVDEIVEADEILGGEAVPIVEEGVPESVISSETEEVLEMITSGAAVEAAINAFPWHLPPIEHLAVPPKGGVATAEIRATSDLIEETLEDHGIAVSVDQVRVGPTVTMY